MSRYTIELPSGKAVQMYDYMITENGIEGIQVDDEGSVTLVLITEGGMVIYDHKSGKSKDCIQESRDAYAAMARRQQEQFKARTQAMVDASEPSEDEVVVAVEPRDEDGPMFELPALDECPPGYA